MKVHKKYKLTLTALSPIHIGTGEEWIPFEYVIKNETLYFLDLAGFIGQLKGDLRIKFDYAVNQKGYSFIRKFIYDNVDVSKFAKFSIPVSDAISDIYIKDINSSSSESQLIINPFIRNLDSGQPLIPGSSIKGALRTAVVSAAANAEYQSKVREINTADRRWENTLLKSNDPKDDPFRAVCIEDITLAKESTIIDEAVIYKPEITTQNPSSIQQFYEMTYSKLEGKDVVGQGMMFFYEGLKRVKFNGQDYIKLPLDADAFVQTCKKFYINLIDYEHNKFYKKDKDLEPVSKQLKTLTSNLSNNEFPIRLGRFSHCESVTIDVPYKGGDGIEIRQARQPKTRRGKNGKPLPWGTTRTLAFERFPMGWAKCRLELI